MKRLRLDRWTSPLLAARPAPCPASRPRAALRPTTAASAFSRGTAVRYQSTDTTPEEHIAAPQEDYDDGTDHVRFPPLEKLPPGAASLPSPPPERALRSAKLAALKARLALPDRVPLQTLARALVDASADQNRLFNNSSLAFVGQTFINYHVSEWLLCRYPRLPMKILYAAMKGYAGPISLHHVARSWGIEHAAAPGGEVDPGLLQFSMHKPGDAFVALGYRRSEADHLKHNKWRHSLSNSVVFDDDFGDLIDTQDQADKMRARPDTEYGNEYTRMLAENAYATCVRAVVGTLYAHAGREPAKAFVKAHILARTLEIERLFSFKHPTRELSMLCAREDFEAPVARLLSETGRLSRTPVYNVGIFSGGDKLGEGAAASLDHARAKAAMNALMSWYLYSPGENVSVPSDMLEDGAKPWTPAYIDMGEVVGR
ncbi:ribonuclease III domain-containing protein [Staphylotrichum tortipilum]|uniref:Large ribosomal subunit protein mL44 n=1 Tax=Staphylotrichum tortipilum TaxID=2831512 RepID=A0AAN6RXY7_9PEZI|nr:ribonuclease III domain-containing protein [Staphylotrichum longicolle]